MREISRPRVLALLLTCGVVAAVATGIFLIGSPAEERARRLDERRVQDLDDIARAVDLYRSRHATLPSSLEELGKEPGVRVGSSDPGTGAPYEYRLVEAEKYELCARFERDSVEVGQRARDTRWSHAAGRQCFRRKAREIP